MCGIAGIIAFNDKANTYLDSLPDAIQCLKKRGPDSDGVFKHQRIALGHSRLSIIDTSSGANQPFSDTSGRYTVVFNGEIYNYASLKQQLEAQGITFITNGDTEVLLYAYIHWGAAMLNKLNGFFAFAIYDKQTQTTFIARDRIGIKPLLIFKDDDKLLFASEMKALLAMGIPRIINQTALYLYLQLSYIPPPYSIFKEVYKLKPGQYLLVQNKLVTTHTFYQIPYQANQLSTQSYEQAQQQLVQLMEDSVKKRLVADVPIGAFLSGGIDSSVITALATKHHQHLHTFSIGYKDEPLFDETKYAQLVAKQFKTNHTVFALSNDDLFGNLFTMLDYIDEPFADASALAVNILSMHTAKKVKVALSGDGGDELFAGYNKHAAEWRARQGGWAARLVKWTGPVWANLPQSRSSRLGNLVRQLNRFASGVQLGHQQRYWQWASLMSMQDAANLLVRNINQSQFLQAQNQQLQYIQNGQKGSLNEILYADMHGVLQGDMLTKTDSMSMAHSLEVRTPFLDHRLVNFAFTLPVSYKINAQLKKRVLQDAFRQILPTELYNRPKHGFDVPLLKWLRKELKELLVKDLLSEDFITAQGIFHYPAIQQLLQQLFSENPGDAAANVWTLLVFQYWWKRYLT